MSDINSFIESLNVVIAENSVEVFLPSLQRTVKFKPINTKQYKDICGSMKDNAIYNTRFIIATYNIIKDNCIEPEIVDQLNIIDRLFILLVLRKDILGPKLKDINIESCIALASKIELPISETLNIGNVKITTQIPSIKEVYEMELELRGDLQLKTMSIEDLTQDFIINSCCKFIQNVQAGTVDLNFALFSFKDRLKIIENLPAATLNRLQDFAGKVTSLQDSITNGPNNNNIYTQFYINTDFFLTE